MKKRNRKIPLYAGKLIIIQLDKNESLNDILKIYNIKYNLINADGVAFKDKQNYILAFSNEIDIGTISHESFHAVSYIFKDHEIMMDCNNDEPIAYLLEWIVNECHKFLNLEI